MVKQLFKFWRIFSDVQEKVAVPVQELPKGKIVKIKSDRIKCAFTKSIINNTSKVSLAEEIIVDKSSGHSTKLQKTVEERAREIWFEEGCPEGKADEHWIQAEVELMQ